jgi:hypothetical protein
MDQQQMQQCPLCMTVIPTNAIVCRACGAHKERHIGKMTQGVAFVSCVVVIYIMGQILLPHSLLLFMFAIPTTFFIGIRLSPKKPVWVHRR